MKIPTFDECLEIVKKNESFTHRVRDVDGQKVSVFDYLMASYPDFKNPIDNSDIEAFELRGLCFTHNEDGSIHRRYILLHKFFNLNQCNSYQYDDFKTNKVIQVMDKMDGSIIRFIQLANGKIVSKSKTFFGNDQSMMADEIYSTNSNLQNFVKETLDNNLCAIFELTSPKNRIVVSYNTTKLTLLQLRDENTGEYLDIYNNDLVKKYKIDTVVKEFNLELDYYIEQRKTLENKEGWILIFDNGMMVKIKTEWYCNLHGLLTDYLSKENQIMKMILDSTIDDALSKMDINDERKPLIEVLVKKVNTCFLN
jgi:T4 RnlA family RNA ligase